MHQLLAAVAYCHSKKILHRDLKPENLLFETSDNNAQIKVVDFGTSQTFTSSMTAHYKYGTIYYIAPEVLSNSYNEKCDLWSCGVIMYTLLCGYPPFNGASDYSILEKVKKGVFTFPQDTWKDTSFDAQMLIRKMLTYNPKYRVSAEEALKDSWFQNRLPALQIDNIVAQKALNNLQHFHFSVGLQKAAYVYISSQLSSNNEKLELKKIFQLLDINGDGRLSKDELKDGYIKYFGVDIQDDELDKIIQNIDADHSGYIDYNEFAMIAIDRNVLLSEERLKLAFKLFDIDGNGLISARELKVVLGHSTNAEQSLWTETIEEVDSNSDGGISYSEFKEMMMTYLRVS